MLKKDTGFTTPKNYFEELEQSIISKIAIKKEVQLLSLRTRLLKYIPYTTAVFVASFLSLNYFISSNSKGTNFNTLTQIAITHCFPDNSSELSDQEFATLLHSNLKNENYFAFTFADIKNDAIREYIIKSEDSCLLNVIY